MSTIQPTQNYFKAALQVKNFSAKAISFLVLLMLSVAALAQVGGTGSIQGTVTDASSAVISGATVTATNVATGTATVRKTSDSGFFVLPLLPAGEYQVKVEAPGFETLSQSGVVVDALAVVGLNPQLKIGAINESTVVTTQPTMIKTDDVALGSSIGSKVYNTLPLAMNKSARDPSAFVGLSVGVNSYSTQAAGPSTGSFNGGQPNQNEGYVEGLPLTSAGTEGDTRNLAFGISVEAVDEFQVQTAGGKSMYDGQGVSNYVIKSGTNNFHGSAYEYLRNTAFDARPYFSPTLPPEHQNEFGFNIGGPIKKNKIFFFGNYDGYRYSAASLPNAQTIPTAAERTGDFSAFPQAIYDPQSTVCDSSGVCTRTQFSFNGVLNVIPPTRLSSVSKSYESYLPTNFANGNIASNYIATLPDKVSNDSATAKVDINLSEKNKLFGLYSRGRYNNPLTGSLTVATTSNLPIPYTDSRDVLEYATLAQAKETYTINSNMVNTISWGINRLFIPLTSNTVGGNYPSKAGFTGMPAGTAATGFPDVTFAGSNAPINWNGTNSHTFNEAQTSYTVQENFLWSKGRHNLTFGFQWQALQDNETFSEEAGFTFATAETSNFKAGTGSLDPTTGNSYAGFLLGAVDSSVVPQIAAQETGGRYKTYATYVQDDFKVTPRLTVNAGLRWDVWTPFTEVNDIMSFFNPTLANPLADNRPGALEFAGDGPDSCHCSTPIKQHNRNFAPRVGLAYRVGGDTVVRASYGIFFAHAGGVGGRTNGRQGLSQVGFNAGGSLSTATTGQPAYFWDSGYPGNPLAPPFFDPSYGIGFITAAAGASVGAGPTTAQGLTYGDPDNGGKAPYYEDWTFDIQHSFTPNMSLSVAYTGSEGHWLPGATVANQFTNQIPVQYLALGATLLAAKLSPTTLSQVQAMFPSVTMPFTNFTGTVAQALRPFPQYSGITNPWLDVGNSSYHALQVSANRRFSSGLTFMANYTFSKEMDDLANVRFPGNNQLERSLGTVDHAHVATATLLYLLPFGTGRHWSAGNKVVNQVIGGWQASGIYTFSTGAPLAITSTACVGGGIIDAVCVPNYTPGFSGSVWQNGDPGKHGAAVDSSTHYLNVAAFTAPASLTIGNAPRTAPYGLFAPSIADIDLSVRREFVIHEGVTFAIQGDAFNTLNSVYLAAPVVNMNAANFGSFTAQANNPRKLQLSARVTF